MCNEKTKVCKYNSPIGIITLIFENDALTGLLIEGQKKRECPNFTITTSKNEVVLKTFKWLDTYFSGSEPSFTPPLRLYGTPFQLRVWEILRTIPYGTILTYSNIAKKISPRMSAQAVGNAVGHNPISIIIPCHRVMGANNKLTGYQGGIHLKLALLKLEGLDVDLYH